MFQEDHDQLYGYALGVEDVLQFHIKIIPDGRIESEMKPPSTYPIIHRNQEHNYSTHKQTEQILRRSQAEYSIARMVSDTCYHTKIIKPNNPTHAATLALTGRRCCCHRFGVAAQR